MKTQKMQTKIEEEIYRRFPKKDDYKEAVVKFVRERHFTDLSDAEEAMILLSGYKMRVGGSFGVTYASYLLSNIFWPEDSGTPCAWHPWLWDTTYAISKYKYVSLLGCGASSKSNGTAKELILKLLSDPYATMILVMSTTIDEAKKRIWKSISDYFLAIENLPYCMGTIVERQIRTCLNKNDRDKVFKPGCGIWLIPIKSTSDSEISKEIIGARNQNVVIVADELCEMNKGIFRAFNSNTISNPNPQFIGTANPINHFDPICDGPAKPLKGWDSVHENLYKDDPIFYCGNWLTSCGGISLHFNAEHSPNNTHKSKIIKIDEDGNEQIEEVDKWSFLSSKNIIDLSLASGDMKKDSPEYWRMFVGFPFSGSLQYNLYQRSDLIANKCMDLVEEWDSKPEDFLGVDVGFTNGGDKTIGAHVQYGKVKGKPTLFVKNMIEFNEDVRNTSIPRDFQIVESIKDTLISYSIPASNMAYDATGAGLPFSSIVKSIISKDCVPISFAGAPSNRVVKRDGLNKTLAKDIYTNMVTEIWYSGVELMRKVDVRGLTPTICEQMCSRKLLPPTKNGSKLCYQIQPKSLMKKDRLGSPDHADAFFIALTLILRRNFLDDFRDRSSVSRRSVSGDSYENSYGLHLSTYGG